MTAPNQMTFTQLMQEVAAGRMAGPVCPTCGAPIIGLDYENDVREVEVLEHLWLPKFDGDTTGPLCPTGETKLQSFGSTVTAWCGHVLPEGFAYTFTPRKGEARG